KLITGFLVDFDTPGCEVVDGYKCVSNRGYHNMIINFDDCRVPVSKILGEEHRGFDAANEWLGSTRLQDAAVCVGRARRALGIATEWAATRVQFGQQIGKFQGVSFKLADMQTRLDAAELLTLRAAWKDTIATATDSDMAIAKVFASEMCQFVTDEAIQILGGMGLMDELPLERMWRDTRVDRIWDGTSEIQRHIISRALLRPLGAVRVAETHAHFRRLLAPRSIAVVGGAPAERVVQQCLKLGFAGAIWPVQPKRADLAGVPCVPTLEELPGAPDAVFLGVNRHATIQAMATLR